MSSRFERERDAFRRGDLREARRLLQASGETSLSRDDRAVQRALLAEVLQLAGERDEAVRLASLVPPGSAPPDVTSRAQVVRAVARTDAGDLPAALALFRRGIELARESARPSALAWAQVRLVSALAERLEPGHLAALAPDVRQNVLQAGDAHLTAYFHISEGRLAAKLGATDRAWHHLDLAAALLPDHPNHVLEALHTFAAAALAMWTADRITAVAFGRRALRAARQAGYARLVPNAMANLAQALLHLGHVGEAEMLLDEALAQPAIGVEAELGLLDSKAQAALLRHDTDDAAALLARIDVRRPAVRGDWDWSALSRQETRIRLALASGDMAGAIHLSMDAREAAGRRGDRAHAALFALLEADARLTLGDSGRTRELVDACGQTAGPEWLPVAAERERLLARLAVFGAERRHARVHALRAWRLVDAAGTAQQRDVLLQQLPEPLEAGRPGAVDPSCNTAVRGDVEEMSLDLLAHILAVATRPLLLGQEVAEVLRAVPVVVSADLVVTGDDGSVRERRRLHGEAYDGEERVVAWPLGPTRDGDVSLRVRARDGYGQAALATLGELVAAATALADARRREPPPSASWSDAAPASCITGIFGAGMRTQLTLMRHAAGCGLPVLVTGETGTGKELIAREVHRLSREATGAFVPFNCAAVPRDMLESQLFGHRKGAFTGAATDFGGFVHEAAGGTLFLDEIGELDVTLQPKLLRFLETGEVQRLGEARPASFDVRTIAATNADVDALVARGGFREDLFYRLNVIRLHLPPLRDRRDDIPLLSQHFLERFARDTARAPLRLTSSAREVLTLYDWPGNVRELLNEMRRLSVFTDPQQEVTPELLSRTIRTRALDAARRPQDALHVSADQTLAQATGELERAMVARALKLAGGKVTEAAAVLGVSRKGLFLMRRRLGLQ